MDLTHLCISIAYIHKMQSVRVRTKAQTIVITGKKHASERLRNWKKKFMLRVGLNPQLRWLPLFCLSGFGWNVQQLFSVFPLHKCLQHAVMNERKQLSISNQHIRVPRWHAFNFAQSKLNFKKRVCKKYWFSKKKKSVHQLDSNPLPPECKSVVPIEPYGCGFWAWIFSTSSSSTAAEHNLITTFSRNDKLEVGGWWVYDVRQLICRCRLVNSVTDRLSALYIYRLSYYMICA